MNEKIGPLKAWQWAAAAAAAGLLYWYIKHKSENETVAQPTNENFATGNPVGQGTEGTGGSANGGGAPVEQPAPLPAVPNTVESTTAPGLGAGQLFATELGEVAEGAAALRASGLIPPSEGSNPGHGNPVVKWSRNPAVRKLQQKALAKGENPNTVKLPKARKRRPSPHAKQGAHHHAASHKQQAHKTSPHKGHAPAARKHTSPHPKHTQKPPAHHAATHHLRKHK